MPSVVDAPSDRTENRSWKRRLRASLLLPKLSDGGEPNSLGVPGVFHLDERDTASRDTDGSPPRVGEPTEPTIDDSTFELLLEHLGVVDLNLEKLVSLPDSDSDLHEPIVTPFPPLSRSRTFVSMSRVLLIVGLVGLFMTAGVAGADVASQIRHPATVDDTESQSASPGDSVVVVRGDHLWKISARHLGPAAGDREIAPYWREVVDVNTPSLRSGDPDLIYPGEVVELPVTREQP